MSEKENKDKNLENSDLYKFLMQTTNPIFDMSSLG